MLIFLDDPHADASVLGKKAANLNRLCAQGFRVPAGFAVPATVSLADLDSETLSEAVDRIGGFPVAARSSGTLEDLQDASFAGQYETVLDVGDEQALRSAIERCRQSARSEAVQAYLRDKDLSAERATVTVLVQRMVDAETSGVGFSIHPLTGREEHALVEYCAGLGEALVSGRVAPSRMVLDLHRAEVVEQQDGAEVAQLAPAHVEELRQVLLQVQAHFGAPQDVEWSVDEQGVLWVLQSRPITRIAWRTDVDEYSNADFKDGGVSARVCTPMMYALYRDAMNVSMPRYLQDVHLRRHDAPSETWVRMFYGRPFWNASAVKRALAQVPGFDEAEFDADMGVQKDYGEAGPLRVPVTLRGLLRAVPAAIGLKWQYGKQLRRVPSFGAWFAPRQAGFLSKITELQTTDDATFFTHLLAVLDFHLRTESAYFTTIYNNNNAQRDFRSFVDTIDARTNGKTDVIALMSGLTTVSHMHIQRGLLKLYDVARHSGLEGAAFDEALAEFVRECYFHGDAELDLLAPRWGEQPERIRTMVRDVLASGSPPADPDETAHRQHEASRAEVLEVLRRLKRLGLRRFLYRRRFRRNIGRARRYLSARERMREYSSQCYYVVRHYLLDAGRRLAEAGWLTRPEDVFMLETDELRQVAREPAHAAELRELVQLRRWLFDGYRHLTPPNELGRGVTQKTSAASAQAQDGCPTFQGIGCSQGVVSGVARVVPSLERISEIRQGDILVTRFTDPGWTPALALVSGIVTEVGGLLSHAAVVGREYGIPVVLNVPGITEQLRSGQQMEIDGGNGTVRVLSRAA